MRSFFCILAKIYLAALYGVIGVTGDSLHYLVAEGQFWARGSSADVVVYYHAHHPGQHGHFHRHQGPLHDADLAGHQAAADRSAAEEVAFTDQRSIHDSHVCLLLTVTSMLRLSYASGARTALDAACLIRLSGERVVDHAFEVALYESARGPPLAGHLA